MFQMWVADTPRPKGSWDPQVRAGARGGRGTQSCPHCHKSVRVHLASSSNTEPRWARLCKLEAERLKAGLLPLDGAVVVHLSFYFDRSKYLGPMAADSEYPTADYIGDIDKLTRSVLDALTGTVYGDDRQVTRLLVSKAWAPAMTQAGVLVQVAPLVAEVMPWPPSLTPSPLGVRQ